jgi:hypothetical protein
VCRHHLLKLKKHTRLLLQASVQETEGSALSS